MPGLFVRFGEGGASLPGNARDPQHLGWFEADSLSFPTTTRERRYAASGSVARALSQISLGLPFNASSCKLYTAASSHRCFSNAEIEVFNVAQNRPMLRYKLRNAILGSCQSLPDRMVLIVQFEAMEVQFLSADGSAAPTPHYDLKTNFQV